MKFFGDFTKKISFFLKNIDVFGKKTELQMKGHSKYKTKIGGCFTLILIILSTALFLNFGSDMKIIFQQTKFFMIIL